MKAWLYRILNSLLGKNLDATPVPLILDQMNELRPLPMGVTEFHEWADRIISGAMVPADNDSLKFGLATLLTSMGQTEDHKEDIFFMKSLRRSAIQQVAQAMQVEIRDRAKAKLAEKEADLTLVKNENN